jgi:Na+/proline symporter
MNLQVKQVLIGIYALIGLVFALYKHLGASNTHGFAYHLGQGLVWPAVMFPSLGKAIGGVIMLVIIAAVMMRK